ncbi:MAG TPA: Crp/Fnr family transcriptional regulator [Terriglobales bacterium]|jgi:CRP/FNR family transcriptional regulator|nr:Crp/Fnr family transcriptional regulator [Terriglobales bacterium]
MLATRAAKAAMNTAPESAIFRDFSAAVRRALESVQCITYYPAGAVLFVESQPSSGVFFVSRGRVKLSVSSRDGKTLILRVAEPGEALGVGAAVCGRVYEATAETLEPCEISFIRPSDLRRLMSQYNEFAMRMTEHLSREYNSTCRELRSLMLSESASERLAKLLVGWLDTNGETRQHNRMTLTLTHEEIAQMIGTSRETVTRLLTEFTKKQLVQRHGSTLVVRNRGALESLITA